jgi:hypothetical protein
MLQIVVGPAQPGRNLDTRATIVLLLGLVSLARTVHRSDNAIVYEVDHVLRLGSS